MSGNDIGGHPGTTPLAISGVRGPVKEIAKTEHVAETCKENHPSERSAYQQWREARRWLTGEELALSRARTERDRKFYAERVYFWRDQVAKLAIAAGRA